MTKKSRAATTPAILLCVTGGIAAYKSCEIARLLIKQGCAVSVAMTKAACRFVTPLTFQSLTGSKVATDLFDEAQEEQIGHIRLADTCDLVLVAPATANVIAKAAHGIADDLVTTVLLATKAPVLFAPSMNVNMYEHVATQANLGLLKSRGNQIIDPGVGELACGWEGAGRLAEPKDIVASVMKRLTLPKARRSVSR